MLQQVSVFGDQREEKKKKPSARDTPFLGLVCQVCVTPKWTFNRTGQQFVSIYKIPFTLFSITITIHPPKTIVSTIIVLKTKHFFYLKTGQDLWLSTKRNIFVLGIFFRINASGDKKPNPIR